MVAASIPVTAPTRSGANASSRRSTSSQPEASAAIERAVDAPLVEQDARHRQQQRRVATGPDEDVLVRQPRGLGTTRIDRHHLSAARPQVAQARLHVRCGEEAPLRDGGVGADAEEEVGAIDVRNRNGPHVSVQVVRGGKARRGVLRAGAGPVARSECLGERTDDHRRAVVVNDRIADVQSDRVRPVAPADVLQPRGDHLERLIPGDLAKAAAVAPQRAVQPVGIGVDVGDGDPLRADEAARDRVLVVRPHGKDAPVLHLEFQPTTRFAQVAGSQYRLGHHRPPNGRSPRARLVRFPVARRRADLAD